MRTRYCAWIDGQGLHDIDPSIFILDIVELDPDEEIIKAERSFGSGTRFDRVNRHSLSLRISFAIRERDITRRARIIDEVRRWAHEGYLTTNDRPGKRLYVSHCRLPVASALKWADTLEIVATAYDVPWWEEITATKCEITPSLLSTGQYAGSAQLYNPGTMTAPIECTIIPTKKMDMVRVGSGGQRFIRFEGLDAKAGDTITITHDERGLVQLSLNGESIMDKRTGDSRDEVPVDPGWSTITVRGTAPFSATCTVRGRWL